MSGYVIYINDAMRGAPVANGVAGSRIAILDALLVNGWGQVTLTSLSVTAGIATAVVPTGQTFEVGAIVAVASAGDPTVNGKYKVLTSSSTQVTFALSHADGVIAGVTTAKYASAGWIKPFASTNNAVYRSQKVGGNNRFLRVVDTAATNARVYGYNNMTTVSAGTGNFGSALYWHTSQTAGVAADRYDAFADEQFINFIPQPTWLYYAGVDRVYQVGQSKIFGETKSLLPSGDSWGSVISGATTDDPFSTEGSYKGPSSGDLGLKVERVAAGTGGAISPSVSMLTGTGISGTDTKYGALADSPGGVLIVSRPYIGKDLVAYNTPRALFPGVYTIPQDITVASSTWDARDTITLPNGHLGRMIFTGSYGRDGLVIIDTEGPWE